MSLTAARPTDSQVAVAFIQQLLDQNGGVGTRLPGKTDGQPESWAKTGFVQIVPLPGSGSPYVLRHTPIITAKCWACAPASKQSPWAAANQLAERIRVGCFRVRQAPPLLRLPDPYPPCLVQTAYPLSDPIPVYGDDSSYAQYRFDLQFTWVGEGL